MPLRWSYEPYLTNYEALLLYNVTLSQADDYYYVPLAIAKREETGMKYRYLCIAVNKQYPYKTSHFADIEVYKPVLGEPYITFLYPMDFEKLFWHRYPDFL